MEGQCVTLKQEITVKPQYMVKSFHMFDTSPCLNILINDIPLQSEHSLAATGNYMFFFYFYVHLLKALVTLYIIKITTRCSCKELFAIENELLITSLQMLQSFPKVSHLIKLPLTSWLRLDKLN